MAQVTVKINGYAYTVGCENGQEPHLLAMAEQVESRVDSIKAIGGNSGEARLLVLVALLMADEIHDMRLEIDKLGAAGARPANGHTGESSALVDPDLARALGRLAARAEEIATGLEHS